MDEPSVVRMDNKRLLFTKGNMQPFGVEEDRNLDGKLDIRSGREGMDMRMTLDTIRD